MGKTVLDFEFSDRGVDHVQYFPGVGTAYTNWEAVFIGCGDTARAAADNAAEQLCEVADNFAALDHALEQFDDTVSAHDECAASEDGPVGECDDEGDHDECELTHYVALFVSYTEGSADAEVS